MRGRFAPGAAWRGHWTTCSTSRCGADSRLGAARALMHWPSTATLDASDEFDASVVSMGRGEFRVARDEWCSERFGERDIRGIVRRHGVAQLPDPGQKRMMRIPGNRKIVEVLQRLHATRRIDLPGTRVTTHDLRNLDIEQMRRMQGFARVEKALGDR